MTVTPTHGCPEEPTGPRDSQAGSSNGHTVRIAYITATASLLTALAAILAVFVH